MFLFALLVLFSRVVSAGISHDEYQFIASSQVLVNQGLLPYVDYPFLHMPYQIPVNAAAILLCAYHLLAVRILNAVFFLASVMTVFFLVSRRFQTQPGWMRGLAGFLSSMLLLFDPTLTGMDGRALNHALPVLLSLLAFALFEAWTRGKRASLTLLGCGLLVGLAIGVRLSFAVLLAPFFVILLWVPRLQPFRKRVKNTAVFLAGAGAALLPAGLLVIAAPRNFYFGNYVYIRLNTIYRQEVLFQGSMTPLAKAQYFGETVLSHPASLILYAGLLLTAAYLAARLVRREGRESAVLLLAVLLSLALLAAGFAATPLWPQYFFAPMPFVLISAFSGLAMIPKALPRLLALGGIAAALILGFPWHQTARQLGVLAAPAQWVPVQAHEVAEQVQSIVGDGKVAALAPIYPLEAGLETYSPFIVGPFVWRTAPLLSQDGRRQYDLLSFHEIEAALNADPPAAILTGFETDYGFDANSFGQLEKPLLDYARKHHYQPARTWKPGFWPADITIWIKINEE